MRIITKIKSESSNVVKYVFGMADGLITEFSYIDKNDGKDIICVSTQTLCSQGCKFCHVTDHVGKLKLRNITGIEMFLGINMIVGQEGLEKDCLLISFMGCGEPLCNVDGVLEAMKWTEYTMQDHYETVRFAISTMIPENKWNEFFRLCFTIKDLEYQAKIHLSLHYSDYDDRKEWMPNSLDLEPSVDSLAWAVEHCGVKGEVHYALIEGVNDRGWDASRLATLLTGTDINAKFLYYNEKDTLEAKASSLNAYERFRSTLTDHGIQCEYYIPPGLDVGASCGQFLLEYYEKYNGVTK